MDTNRTHHERLKAAARRRALQLRSDYLDEAWQSLAASATAAWGRLSGRHAAGTVPHAKVARQFR